MEQFRLDGRTAVVTGAGGNPSLGRAYALLLGARGANVVVNDIGRDPEVRDYSGTASAEAVAAEIRAAGGKAVADTHSVVTPEGAEAIIKTAIDAFGGIDILVNNAGIVIHALFDQITQRDFEKQLEINLMGTVRTCRAAWPHMRAKGYGRIINIASASFGGWSWQTGYSASKGGVFSFTRALAAEGLDYGIKANIVNPGAFTRLVAAAFEDDSHMSRNARDNYPAELAAPVVAFLAHDNCPVTGECFEAVGGLVRRIYVAHTEGFTDRDLTVETVASRWDEIMGDPGPSRIGYNILNPDEFRPYKG